MGRVGVTVGSTSGKGKGTTRSVDREVGVGEKTMGDAARGVGESDGKDVERAEGITGDVLVGSGKDVGSTAGIVERGVRTVESL
jgi:hypothetical protein